MLIEPGKWRRTTAHRHPYFFTGQNTIAFANLGFDMRCVWFADKSEAMIFKLNQ
jgi:hypothetical protein